MSIGPIDYVTKELLVQVQRSDWKMRQPFRKLTDMHVDRLGLMSAMALRGDAVKFRLGMRTFLVLNHPHHIMHVLQENEGNYEKGIGLVQTRRLLGDGVLTSERDRWQRQRNALVHSLRASQYDGLDRIVLEETDALTDAWLHKNGEIFDVSREMRRLTLTVLSRSLFGTDMFAHTGIIEAFDVMQKEAMFGVVTLDLIPPVWRSKRHQRLRIARSEIDDAVDRSIASVMANQDAGSGADEDLKETMASFLFAGHETTACLLSWAFYYLAQNPNVAERVHAEAATLGNHLVMTNPSASLPYTVMVLKEVLRLCPPVWLLPRRSMHSDESRGVEIPSASDVLICPYTLHRHPGFWTDPENFDPERFMPGRARDIVEFSYLPFGAGHRSCMGRTFAMKEAALVLALVVRKLSLQLPPNTVVKPDPLLTLRIRGGLPMTAKKHMVLV
jgi:cytochrome P450